jgi:hypothetical protein
MHDYLHACQRTECAHNVKMTGAEKCRSGEELVLRALPPFALTELLAPFQGSLPVSERYYRGAERVKNLEMHYL